MTALNNQTQAIEQQEAALMEQLAQLQAKKQAVVSLESEYTACIEHVKKVMQLMTDAGLDARDLAKDVSALIAPSVTSTRATRTNTTGSNKTNRPGPNTQGGRAWSLFDEIFEDLGTVTTAEVKIRARISMPNDSMDNIVWHLSNWRKAQQLTAPVVVAPIESEPTPAPVEPVATPKPTIPPVFEVSPAPEVSETEAKYIDKKIKAASKVQSKKR